MAVNTILLDFSVDPDVVKNESQLAVAATNIENILRDYLSNLKHASSFNLQGGLVKLYTSDPGATINLRVYNNGLITINIDYFKGESQEPILTYELSKVLEQKLRVSLDSFRSKMLPPIKRGATLDVYLSSSGLAVF